MIKVCDSIMGSGKTQAAIRMMNDVKRPYIFITIYLEEAERIVRSCPDRHFVAPKNLGSGKLDNLHELLRKKENISSTHALFSGYTKETEDLIRAAGYTLVMDEAYTGFKQVPMKNLDSSALTESNLVAIDPYTNEVNWAKEGETDRFLDVKQYCTDGTLYMYSDTFFMWEFPVEILKAFKDVFVLTYMFEGQMLKVYFEHNRIPYGYLHVDRTDVGYQFADGYRRDSGTGLKNKIHIFEGNKINAVGDPEFALSSSWFQKHKNGRLEKQLKDNIRNVFEHKWHVNGNDCLWTVIKARSKAITPKGFGKSFLPWNTKATNNFINRHYLAYCYNIYLNPLLKSFFNKSGLMSTSNFVADDAYALSEMIQWIWRSAIRKGDDIWIYIPSSRMRRLLKNWLEEVN